MVMKVNRIARTTARSIAHQRAKDAGLDPDTADAVVQSVMAIFDPEYTFKEWKDFVDQEIQRHAAP
jgi:hypothetical protein